MVKYCPNCGRPNPDNARFCAYCGYDLSAVPSAGAYRAQTAQAYQTAYYRRPAYIEFEYPSWLKYLALVAGIMAGIGFILGGVLSIATSGGNAFSIILGAGVLLLGISVLLSGIIFNPRLVSIMLMLYGILVGVSLIYVRLTVEGIMYILFGLFALLAGIFSSLQTKAGYIVSSIMTYLLAIFFMIGTYKVSSLMSLLGSSLSISISIYGYNYNINLGFIVTYFISLFTMGSNYILAFVAMLVLATALILYGALQSATGKFITYLMLSIAGILMGIGLLLPNIEVISGVSSLGSHAFSVWQLALMTVGSIMLTIGGVMAMIYSILGLIYTIMSYTRGY